MKNYVFHLVCKRKTVASSETLLPLVDESTQGRPAPQNELLLIYKLPSNDPNAAIAAVFNAKKRGWTPPIDQLSFFLNRTDDVFLLDWTTRRLLTRATFEALRNRGKLDVSQESAPYYAAEILGRSRVVSAETSEAEPFEYLAIGDFAGFLADDDRRYFGSQTLSVEYV